MKGKPINYTQAQHIFLREHEKTPRRELTKLFNKEFDQNLSIDSIKAKCLRMGLKTGRTGCFVEGQVSITKGTKGICGQHPNSRKTQFKKGQEPHNTKHIGHERLTKDGYIMISVNQVNPHTGYRRSYVLKHHHIWEKANGPIPEGMCLKFIDGIRTNCELDNLKLITQAQNAILNKTSMGSITNEALDSALLIVDLKSALSQKTKELSS